VRSDHTGWTGYHVNVRHRPDPRFPPASEVLVALDGSEAAERSLEVADALAAAADLPLHLVTVRATRAQRGAGRSYLDRVARRAPRVSDLSVEIDSDAAHPLGELAGEGSLVVLATHARRAAGEILLGSVADRVLRATERPVLLVGPHAGVGDPEFSSMLLPDDGGVGATQVRPWAQMWSEHLLAVPWVVQVLPPRTGLPSDDTFESAHVESMAGQLGPGAAWDVLHGHDPAERIVAFAADLPAGMIAMSVPARHRVGPDVGGGVALRVVRHAPCPVLALGRRER
jgi:nucleotide-binding universal stress UspA family protein